MESANSTEFDGQTPNPVVIFMPEVYIYHEVVSVPFVMRTAFSLQLLSFHLGLKNSYGKHDETGISKNAIADA